ncbi:hypothetical protein [Saccharothrix sp. ALI-22-I]|uniref:hypothetical protein n=1 Tax=Saccharothrix sp. ALI-22-I TaxID=1933778 RepID=UPI0015C3ADB2|nr:hypothetical protein [Saccharothrix sp. ALI-22-I]
MTRESLTTDPRTEPPTARAWAAAVAPILLLAAISAYLSDGRTIRTAVAFAGAGVSIVLVVLLAGLALGRRHLVPGALTPVAVAVAAVMLLVVANSLPTLPALAGLDGSWQAKLLNLVWLGILLACWPAGRRAVGLTTVRPQPGSGRPILLAASAAATKRQDPSACSRRFRLVGLTAPRDPAGRARPAPAAGEGSSPAGALPAGLGARPATAQRARRPAGSRAAERQ